MKFDRKYIARRAEMFSLNKFKKDFFDILEKQGFDFQNKNL
jgi:hypothetical protein